MALTVRDDGSSDGTLALLDGLLSGRRRTKLVMGAHLGVAQSISIRGNAVGVGTAHWSEWSGRAAGS